MQVPCGTGPTVSVWERRPSNTCSLSSPNMEMSAMTSHPFPSERRGALTNIQTSSVHASSVGVIHVCLFFTVLLIAELPKSVPCVHVHFVCINVLKWVHLLCLSSFQHCFSLSSSMPHFLFHSLSPSPLSPPSLPPSLSLIS